MMCFPDPRKMLSDYILCVSCGWNGKTKQAERIITLASASSKVKAYKCPNCGETIYKWG